MPSVRIKRGTRAQVTAAAAANQLAAGEPYLITDEARLAVGTGAGAFATAAKPGEAIHVGTSAPADTSALWIDTDEPDPSIPLSDGWMDITPVWTKDDGSGGWLFTALGSGRSVLRALGTGGAAKLVAKYHIPHDLKLSQSDGEIYFHLHLECEDQGTGNAVLACQLFAALPNGAWSSAFTLTFTITPASMATSTNHIIEQALPTGMAAYLVPDAIWSVNIIRDPAAAGDTYTGAVYFTTADMHVKGDQRLTTSKDIGTGWVKA